MYESDKGLKFIDYNICLQTLYFYGNRLMVPSVSARKKRICRKKSPAVSEYGYIFVNYNTHSFQKCTDFPDILFGRCAAAHDRERISVVEYTDT